jgi:hypothetical protein
MPVEQKTYSRDGVLEERAAIEQGEEAGDLFFAWVEAVKPSLLAENSMRAVWCDRTALGILLDLHLAGLLQPPLTEQEVDECNREREDFPSRIASLCMDLRHKLDDGNYDEECPLISDQVLSLLGNQRQPIQYLYDILGEAICKLE